MKLKHIFFACSGFFVLLFALLLVCVILFSEEDGSGSGGWGTYYSNVNLSEEVLAHRPMVERYANEYGISKYVCVLLAIMQVESGGRGEDVMQCSESLGLPPNSLRTEASIKQGCYYFSCLLSSAEAMGCDLDSVIQSYNYGGGFLYYVEDRGRMYSFELAESFSKEKSNGRVVSYKNDISIPINGGWKYAYGNMFYVPLVRQYLIVTPYADDIGQEIVALAVQFEGWKYVWGGASPSTSFDCSGLVYWCYAQVGITVPRVASAQYNATEHIPLSEAQPGDLVFFHSTFPASTYITHVGIYVGENRMFHAGSPLGYADLTSSYWQAHFVCAGRVPR